MVISPGEDHEVFFKTFVLEKYKQKRESWNKENMGM